MDARNTGPDWPRRPTTQTVVMGVAVVTGLPNGPWLSGWIKSDIRAPGLALPPFLGLLPLGAPQLNDVIEEGSLNLQCVCVSVCVCVCGLKLWMCKKKREWGRGGEQDRQARWRDWHDFPNSPPLKKVLLATISAPSVSSGSSTLYNGRAAYLSSMSKTTVALERFDLVGYWLEKYDLRLT